MVISNNIEGSAGLVMWYLFESDVQVYSSTNQDMLYSHLWLRDY